MKMIRGKYDSQFKFIFDGRRNKITRILERGTFDTAMNYACRVRGGMKAIDYIRRQPWESWRPLRRHTL